MESTIDSSVGKSLIGPSGYRFPHSITIGGVCNVTDGGGKVQPALNPIYGPSNVVRFFIEVGRKIGGWRVEPVMTELNREPAYIAERQANRQDDPAARERIIAKYGDQGLIDLAFAIVGSRAFPTFKRVLGYARTCTEFATMLSDERYR